MRTHVGISENNLSFTRSQCVMCNDSRDCDGIKRLPYSILSNLIFGMSFAEYSVGIVFANERAYKTNDEPKCLHEGGREGGGGGRGGGKEQMKAKNTTMLSVNKKRIKCENRLSK